MVSAFLKTAAREAQGLDPRARADRLVRIKAVIREGLSRSGDAHLADDEVAALLNRCKVQFNGKETDTKAPWPSEPRHVEKANRAAFVKSGTGLASDQRCWLGVCAALSERFGVGVAYIRGLFFLFGIPAGPIALLIYTAIYFQLYFTARDAGASAIDPLSLLRNIFAFLAITAVLYAAGRGAFLLTYNLYPRFMEEELILNQWGWLEEYQRSFLYIVLIFGAPMAILCSLPMRRAWDYTWKRVMQAGLAVYAVILSFGIASILVGIVLLVVEEVAGTG